MIYVIGPDGSSVAKIGYTKHKPAKRLAELQVGNPAALSVLWSCEGDMLLEGKLHDVFRPYHLRGEWYDFRGLDPVDMVKAAVSSISRGVTLVVPTSPRLDCVCGHKSLKHETDGCTVIGFEEWFDCQCVDYVSQSVLANVPSMVQEIIPAPRQAVHTGPRNAERIGWYEVVRSEASGMRWAGGERMIPGYWPDHLADKIVWRVLNDGGLTETYRLVLSEVADLKWPRGGRRMVPGGHAEDLAEAITKGLRFVDMAQT